MATKLFVGRLSFDTTDEKLQQLFGEHGTVSSAQVIMDRSSGQSKGFAFVEMEDQAAAQKAIQALDGQSVDGRTISVSVARPREDRPQENNGSNFHNGFRRR